MVEADDVIVVDWFVVFVAFLTLLGMLVYLVAFAAPKEIRSNALMV